MIPLLKPEQLARLSPLVRAEYRIRYKQALDVEREKIYAQLPWSKRWKPIIEQGLRPLSGERYKYWHSEKRFNVVAAGLRSLKTEIGKRRLIRSAVRATPHPFGGRRFGFASPTQQQSKRIAWRDLIALCPRDRIKSISETDLKITLQVPNPEINNPDNDPNFDTEIWVLGFDKTARAEGASWDGLHLTEYADMPKDIWGVHIRPLVADREGWITLEGRPDYSAPNNDNFKELFELGLSGKDPEWISFRWSASDIISTEEYDSLRSTMTDEEVRQEGDGSFETAPGRAYGYFSYNTHVKETPYDPMLNVRISCDFNIGHHNWGIYQVASDGEWRSIDQVYLQNAMVDDMLKELKEMKLEPLLKIKSQMLNRKATLADLNIIFYGDYAGQNRTAFATYTGWRQIRNAFEDPQGNSFAEFEYRVAPPIGDRINKVNGKLKSADGKVHARIDPKCKQLIRDLEKVTRKMLFSQQKDGEITHASDALGYAICQYER